MQAKALLFFAAAMFIAATVSGCTQVPAGTGIDVLNFETDFSEVMSGERVDFYVRMKNTGSLTADNVFAELLGLDASWYDPEEEPLGGGPWAGSTENFKEKLPNEENCRYTGSGSSLMPPNPFFGTDGQEKTCSWSYKAPEIPSGTSLIYEPKVRVYYNYKTTAKASITLLPRTELIRMQNSGQSPPSHIITESSSPVDIELRIQPSIRVSGNGASFPLEIALANIGGGVCCLEGRCKKHGSAENVWNTVTVRITSSQGISLKDKCSGEIIVPFYRNVATIVCDADVGLENLNTAEQRTIDIEVSYDYFVDKKILLTVTGA